MHHHDPCAVNSLVATPGCSPTEGRVVWDPLHSLWNGGMLAATLIFGAMTFSLAAVAAFLVTTGARWKVRARKIRVPASMPPFHSE